MSNTVQLPYSDNMLLAALETAMSENERAFQAASALHRDLTSAGQLVHPSGWAKQIELKLGDTVELAIIRARHREAIITFEQKWAQTNEATNCFRNSRFKLQAALGQIVQHVEQAGIAKKTFFAHFAHTVWRSALVRGVAQHRKELEMFTWYGDYGYLCKQGLAVLQAEFTALGARNSSTVPSLNELEAEELFGESPEFGCGTELVCSAFSLASPRDAYSSDPRLKLQESRQAVFVAFTDQETPETYKTIEAAKTAGLVALAALLPQLHAAKKRVKDAFSFLKQDAKGRVNEVNYAERLVQQVLVQSVEDNAEKHVCAQEEERYRYEQARISLFMSILDAYNLHAQTFNAFKLAVSETQQIDNLVQADLGAATALAAIQRKALVNCLGAEVLLRSNGRLVTEALAELYNADMTGGNGRMAVDKRFQQAMAYYAKVTAPITSPTN